MQKQPIFMYRGEIKHLPVAPTAIQLNDQYKMKMARCFFSPNRNRVV